MQSLTELNSHSRFIYEVIDSRPAKVVFDRLLSVKTDQTITAALTVTVPEAINIAEIINYSTANVRFRVTLNTPVGFNSSLTWATIPAGLTLTQVGKVYTITGIKTPAEWNIIKNFTWNIPANFSSFNSWSLTCEIIYFDQALNQDVSVSYDVFDPNYYIVSEMINIVEFECFANKIIKPQITLSSESELVCDIGFNLLTFTNLTVTARRFKGVIVNMATVNSLAVAKVDNFLTVSYTIPNNIQYPTDSKTVRFDIFGVTGARVYWGDGTFNDINTNGRVSKIYSNIGTYKVTIIGGYTGFFNRSKNLRRVLSFPETGLTKLGGLGADLLEIPSQLPSSVTDLSNCFAKDLFAGTNYDIIDPNEPHFNLPTIANWDISNVTDISGLLSSNRLFNTSLNNWNTANVTNMAGAFGDSAYTQPLNNWNTQNVTDMSSMFAGVGSRPNPFNQNISNWNTSNVVNMNNMFRNSAFNQPIGNWDVSKVTDFGYMFEFNRQFNQPLNNWNTISAIIMRFMFAGSVFNQPIGNWNTANVRTMNRMFEGYTTSLGLPKHPFNQPIGNWNVGNVRTVQFMFKDSVFNQPIGSWNTQNFSNPVGAVDGVTGSPMRGMFQNNTAFDQNISGWCMTYQTTKPQDFDTGTSTNWITAEKPQWGLCP